MNNTEYYGYNIRKANGGYILEARRVEYKEGGFNNYKTDTSVFPDWNSVVKHLEANELQNVDN